MKQRLPLSILFLSLVGNTALAIEDFPPPPGPFGLIDRMPDIEPSPEPEPNVPSTDAAHPRQGFGPVITDTAREETNAPAEKAAKARALPPMGGQAETPSEATPLPTTADKPGDTIRPPATSTLTPGFGPVIIPPEERTQPAMATAPDAPPRPAPARPTAPADASQETPPLIPAEDIGPPADFTPAPASRPTRPAASDEAPAPASFRPLQASPEAAKASPPALKRKPAGDWRFAPPDETAPQSRANESLKIQLPDEAATLHPPSASIQMRWPPATAPAPTAYPGNRIKSGRSLYEALTRGNRPAQTHPVPGATPYPTPLDPYSPPLPASPYYPGAATPGYPDTSLDSGMSWGRR